MKSYSMNIFENLNFYYIFSRQSKQPSNNNLISTLFFAKSFWKKSSSIFFKGKFFNFEKKGYTDKI